MIASLQNHVIVKVFSLSICDTTEDFVCVDCGCVFEHPKSYVERHGLDSPPYEKTYGCPKCGGAYVKARKCDNCNQFITDGYVVINDGSVYCDECYTERSIDDDL